MGGKEGSRGKEGEGENSKHLKPQLFF